MASVTDVCNIALQAVGSKTISSLAENTPQARACALAYPIIRQSEIRKHEWNFAITRVSLSAEDPEPDWGRANEFLLPSDFLRLTNNYPESASPSSVGVTVQGSSGFTGVRDWVIEGKSIITNDSAPLQVRYIADITDTTLWDSSFVMVMAYGLALHLCEQLTQSNTKKQAISAQYEEAVKTARKSNAFDKGPIQPPVDSWESVRN